MVNDRCNTVTWHTLNNCANEFILKNNCKYKSGLGNAHPTMQTKYVFFLLLEKNCKYKRGLGNAHPATKYVLARLNVLPSVSKLVYVNRFLDN
jgi:hypothetical protein